MSYVQVLFCTNVHIYIGVNSCVQLFERSHVCSIQAHWPMGAPATSSLTIQLKYRRRIASMPMYGVLRVNYHLRSTILVQSEF